MIGSKEAQQILLYLLRIELGQDLLLSQAIDQDLARTRLDWCGTFVVHFRLSRIVNVQLLVALGGFPIICSPAVFCLPCLDSESKLAVTIHLGPLLFSESHIAAHGQDEASVDWPASDLPYAAPQLNGVDYAHLASVGC
jgi:hypothetical protein